MRASSSAALAEVLSGARFMAELVPLLRRPVPAAVAQAIVRERLRTREADFLHLVRAAVYAQPASPYRQLLRLAGCEPGDLERLVKTKGLEGALRTLHGRGVYLSLDELKGRTAAVRGSSTIEVGTEFLGNPLVGGAVRARSSGSRGAGTPVPINPANQYDLGISAGVELAAHDGLAWRKALWAVPGGAAVAKLLRQSIVGRRPERWFSQVDPDAAGLHPRYAWSARAVRLASLLAGRPLPAPEYVPMSESGPVKRWLADTFGRGEVPCLYCGVSAAVNVCQAAEAEGLDLTGTRFFVGGEPLTQMRLNAIRASGAVAVPQYAAMEAGILATGCLAPAAVDDQHVYGDLNVLTQPGVAREGPSGDRTLFATSLRPTARLILLNASLGDQAIVEERDCGCPLQEVGWTTHLRAIRSREKLTSAGMTFVDADLVRVLDEVLPALFGGGPTDYQLVEEEGKGGRPRLRLLVHPAVGAVDTEAVKGAFLDAISQGAGVERVMGTLWREAGILEVERRAPESTYTGKILHLHQRRSDHAT